MAAFSKELALACSSALSHLRHRLFWYLLALLLVAASALLLLPHDAAWSQSQRALDPTWTPLARKLSFWGDYLTGTVPVAALLFLMGRLLSRPAWKRAALACLLAASLAGLSANVLCFTLGRPRPCTSLPDGFYGPSHFGKYDYRSFPSGHSATSFGTATAVAVALPELGLPCLIFAGGVAWSRVELGRHFPSDVFVGAALGIAFGIAFGSGARSGARR